MMIFQLAYCFSSDHVSMSCSQIKIFPFDIYPVYFDSRLLMKMMGVIIFLCLIYGGDLVTCLVELLCVPKEGDG